MREICNKRTSLLLEPEVRPLVAVSVIVIVLSLAWPGPHPAVSARVTVDAESALVIVGIPPVACTVTVTNLSRRLQDVETGGRTGSLLGIDCVPEAGSGDSLELRVVDFVSVIGTGETDGLVRVDLVSGMLEAGELSLEVETGTGVAEDRVAAGTVGVMIRVMVVLDPLNNPEIFFPDSSFLSFLEPSLALFSCSTSACLTTALLALTGPAAANW